LSSSQLTNDGSQEENANQHLLQLGCPTLVRVLRPNEEYLHKQVRGDHCQQQVGMADELIIGIVRTDDVDVRSRINRTQESSDADAIDGAVPVVNEES